MMNTSFFALAGAKAESLIPKRIPVNIALKNQLSKMFAMQQEQFFKDRDLLSFDPRYTLNDDEVFEVVGFAMPSLIVDAAQHPENIENLNLVEDKEIKCVMCAMFDHADQKLNVLFQIFDRQRMLAKDRTILLSGGTFTRLTEPGITLDSRITAAFNGGNLYFQKFGTVSRFLDLSKYFAEATNDDITDVLSHKLFTVDSIQQVFESADSVMRKQFMFVKTSGILDRVTLKTIQEKCNDYNIQLTIKKKQIQFPGNKREGKELLSFLKEGIYKGVFTDTIYVTNSQRALASKTKL